MSTEQIQEAVRVAVETALRSVQGGNPLGKSAVLPLSEIKKLTGIGWPTLNRYRDSGELAVIWIGGTQYVTLEGWQRFIASRPVSTEAENIVRERLLGTKYEAVPKDRAAEYTRQVAAIGKPRRRRS